MLSEKISNGILSVEIENLGAQLKSVVKNGVEYLWQGGEAWKGRAYNLFPVVGRLVDSKYLHNGVEYTLPIHGFIKTTELKTLSNDGKSVTFYTESNEETKKVYPFDFEYKITYTLVDDTLKTTYEVKNTGAEDMYFAVGGHPGINLPLEGDKSDWYLEFENECKPSEIRFNEKGLFYTENGEYSLYENKKFFFNKKYFDGTGVYFKGAAKGVTLKSDKSDLSVKVTYPDMRFIAFWTTEDYSQFVCIEPWDSLPDPNMNESQELKDKPYMTKLSVNETFVNGFDMKIK